ncbi:MAG: Asp-tRNA(Asn)/Glu-tRNA(Gln) amidotransferase subunit GatB [Candidatus Nealsonbacteria bacterium CG_4_8_14_3_um_filter_39_7]|nr:MAG: Asp-tRNA(Asn)/Glu-tRNA(Gln) amidotransferase subunit GatB [Candidatus Nealsonbacteria bacterium CG07_land_8_20_14_0_80_39_13]PIW91390.1 MAG: Asp-tRNA(Asn)/Glu-tRNA(Gln) amidotransferase subunit GatB [Candidatus Nealsonbacteria bacterium CG_4_8_14_3_um_filter_39_7]
MGYFPVIGLEIHTELKTKTKMFCGCLNDPDEKNPARNASHSDAGGPNVNICPVCMGHPGTLPVINKEAVRKVIKTGLAVDCQILEDSKFDRKNYFYPDLPKGYQISQYDKPLCLKGVLKVGEKNIEITRIHLEEDTGKLAHSAGQEYSLVDFNRAGIPLMELVTEPVITSAKEAREFAEKFQLILRYIGVSDADMEKGQMRVEANISITKDLKKLGTKVEIKNLNSFKSVERGIDYEIKRQEEVLISGGKIIQETRGWDEVKGKTFSQREKEGAHDYRYFPEPDLPPMEISSELINEIKAELPELPSQRGERFKRDYFLDEKIAEVLVANKSLGDYFEKVVSTVKNREDKNFIKLASNYIITVLQSFFNKSSSVKSTEGKDFKASPENFAEVILSVEDGRISSTIAKVILEEMFETGKNPSLIIKEKGLVQITDEGDLNSIVKEVISENQKAVEDFKKGKEASVQFMIGKLMEKTKGKANPDIVRKLLRDNLAGS